jgi:dihydroxyacetone kinase
MLFQGRCDIEKILLNNELADDFTVKTVDTEPLTDDDLAEIAQSGVDTVKAKITHRTSVIAERADGSILFGSFCHGAVGIISDKLSGAIKVGEMKIGFYLRKAEQTSENKIIQATTKNIVSLANFKGRGRA